ncbi:MAG: DUF924 family protein [Gammaproteobacteria bacterium]
MAPVVTAEHVLATWFEDFNDEPAVVERHLARWFSVDPAYDAHLRQTLGPACEHALAGGYQSWSDNADGRLALIVLLDQVTRNIHRGTARAFAGDARAYALATDAIASGLDRQVGFMRRSFYYMPLEHAEDLGAQQRYLEISLAREREAPPDLLRFVRDYTAAGREHLAVIERFGRFPHRNVALGRGCTAEESAWLAQRSRHWGQEPPSQAS